MIFILISLISTQIINDCDLPEGMVVSTYISKKCFGCSEIFEVIEEINAALTVNQKNIIFRNVDCDICECKESLIQDKPIIIITDDKNEIRRMKKKPKKENIVAFLSKNLDKEINFILNDLQPQMGAFKKLTFKELSRPLYGPWLLMFYDEENKILENLLYAIHDHYGEKLNIGYIYDGDLGISHSRFNITYFPTLMGYYNGLMNRFEEEYSISNLIAFCDVLLGPRLPEINYSEFLELQKENIKVPIFIVFYKNMSMADFYFRNIAHENKFRIKMYKSGDERLMNYAQVEWKTLQKNFDPKNMVVLAVNKNNLFHKLKITTFSYSKITEWMFHSHYPLINKIDRRNMSSLLRGYKPVILLVTQGEKYDDLLEKLSEEKHTNLPYIKYLFATLDADKITDFVEYIVPSLPIPSVLICDPFRQYYYTEIRKYDKNNFSKNVNELIDLYENSKLQPYPFKKSYKTQYMILVLFIILSLGLIYTKTIGKVKVS